MATSLLNFFDKLRIASYTFELGENLIHSRTGGGEILTAETGPRLWRGSITLSAMSHDDARQQAALVNGMMNAGADFEVLDKKRQYPLKKPATGTILYPTVNLATTVGRVFKFTSRQAGLVFSPGDLFTFSQQETAVMTRRILNEVSEGVTTPASGTIFNITMSMPHRGTSTINPTSPTFDRPFCNAKIVPGSVTPFSRYPDHASGLSFEWIQSIRA